MEKEQQEANVAENVIIDNKKQEPILDNKEIERVSKTDKP